MRCHAKRLCAILGLAALMLAGPSLAAAKQPDATLYELVEDMTFDMTTGVRAATSAIQGTARAGTPFCPDFLLDQLVSLGLIPPHTRQCTVNALASNRIDTTLTPPSGPFGGELNIVIERDNPVDAPELVVLHGSLDGQMHVADAQGRLIQMTGTFTVPGLFASSFTGIFRLPFALDEAGKPRRPHRLEQAFYLMDNGRTVPVQPDERALGYATVRVEVTFE